MRRGTTTPRRSGRPGLDGGPLARVPAAGGLPPRGLVAGGLLAVACAACSNGPTGTGLAITFTAGPVEVRQGDVVAYVVRADEAGGGASPAAIGWSVEPASAGRIEGGRFVAYEPGPARIVAESGGARAVREIVITSRGVPAGTFSVVGRGAVDDRFTSDLWLHGSFAYSGTWGARAGPSGTLQGDRLYAWDVSDPAAPRLTDSVSVDAGTVNDVKIRADGTLAVMTHEGSSDGLNGITLLDLSDPLHPAPIVRYTDTLEPGVHNVWIEGDFVFAAVDESDPASGLRVIDISDPANPAIASSFFGGNPQQNFGQFLHDVYVRDGLAFLSHWDAGLIILDVGNGISGGSPGNPIEVGRIQTAGGDVHNAWYWPATGYVFVGEEDFGTPGIMHVVDASTPALPREVATFRVPGTTPHNFWLDEQNAILYLAWYGEGLIALDVSGELMGELDRQGRTIARSLYGGPGGCPGTGTCTWAPQLHQGNVWVSDQGSGIWALRPEF